MYIIFIFAIAYAFMAFQKKIYSNNWNRDLYVNVAFEKNQVTEGEDTVIVESVINNKWIPLPFLFINFKLENSFKTANMERVSADDKFTRNDLINVLMKQSVKKKIKIVCSRRGCYSIDSFSIKAYNLFLNEKFIEDYSGKSMLTVYPGTVDVRRFEELLKRIDGNLKNNDSFYDDCFLIRGCREYQPYDEMKYINWKATAKTGDLKVNVFDKISNSNVFIYVNLESLQVFADNEVLEESIRLAKSFAIVLSDYGMKSCVITNGKPQKSNAYVTVRKSDTGPAYLNRVDEALASIDLRKSISSKTDAVDETFSEHYCNEILENADKGFIILISNSHEKNLCSCMRELKRHRNPFIWITPVASETEFENFNTIEGNEYAWRLKYEGAEEMI